MQDDSEVQPELLTLDERLHEVWSKAVRDGQSMPGEPALAAELEMGRPAVREALVRLEERGYIRRRKGADTVVNPTLLDIPARFDRQIDKMELIASMGHTPSLEVISTETTPVSIDEAVAYGIAPGTSVFRVVKVWRADGMPVMLARDAVPVRGKKRGAADAATSIFEQALLLGNEHVEWEVVWPGADVLGPDDASTLHREIGEPVLTVELTGVGRSGNTGYWASELHVRGALRYAMVRSVRF